MLIKHIRLIFIVVNTENENIRLSKHNRRFALGFQHLLNEWKIIFDPATKRQVFIIGI